MLKENDINKLISKMTDNLNTNISKIRKAYYSLEYTDEDYQSLLHIFVDNKYNEDRCFLAIKALLKYGLSPNLEDYYDYNFIQTALYAGYSEDFILKIINEALKYGLDVNHVDSDKDTIMHTTIYSDDYSGEIINIYKLLCENGFNSNKVDHDNRNLVEAMKYQNQYLKTQRFSTIQIEEFQKLFMTEVKFTNNSNQDVQVAITTTNIPDVKKEDTVCEKSPEKINIPVQNNPITATITTHSLSENEIAELEKYGKVLNRKQYFVAPTIGREKELKNLMITLAQDKKRPLIVGESGVGKTSIVDELAYRIKTGQVPQFLQEKIILEISPAELVAGCRYVGMFEEVMTKLMKLCEKYNPILFIDEIHAIYGVGAGSKENNDMASMLKYYIDRTNLKVIGTTTEKEYTKYFSTDALKRRFEKITIKEPTKEVLEKIVDKVLSDYSLINKITFENEVLKTQIANILISYTDNKHRDFMDIANNPDLVISVIDKAFAFAKFYDSALIEPTHFIESFELCDRLYSWAREQAILQLRNLNNSFSKPVSKIIKFDSNRY